MATSIRLTTEIEQRLDYLAAQTGRTKAFYLREIIERGIEDMEDYYLAANVLERVRKGEEKVYSTEHVRKDLGLDDLILPILNSNIYRQAHLKAGLYKVNTRCCD